AVPSAGDHPLGFGRRHISLAKIVRRFYSRGPPAILDAVPVFGNAVPIRSADRRVVSPALAVFFDWNYPANSFLRTRTAFLPGAGRRVSADPQAAGRFGGRSGGRDVLRLGRILRRTQLAAGEIRSRCAAAVDVVGFF